MSDEGEPVPEPDGKEDTSGSAAFLPIGIVFVAVAIFMILLGTTAWVAFLTPGITFLILGMQKPAGEDKPLPGEALQG